MEKISRIVRGNARVAASDVKSAAPVRPGMPSFGRPVGESTNAPPKTSSTASRAVALHNAQVEKNMANSQERVISRMADDFFMSRVRRPADESATMAAPDVGPPTAPVESAEDELGEIPVSLAEAPPSEYTPRGSYLDVRA